MALCSYGQEESEHMTFKGIPIDGTFKEFTTQLKQKGFVQDEEYPEMFHGSFAGYNGCKVIVSSDKDIDVVGSIGVILPITKDWNTISNQYYSLKEGLTEKYGKPIKEKEEFQRPEFATDNFYKFHEMVTGRAEFLTMYLTEKGSIALLISPIENLFCEIMLYYVDLINGLKTADKNHDDL